MKDNTGIQIQAKSGKKYQLVKHDISQRHLQKPSPYLSQITTILSGAKPITHSDWVALWRDIKPITAKALLSDEEIISEIETQVKNKDLQLIELSNLPRTSKGSAVSTTSNTSEGSGNQPPTNYGPLPPVLTAEEIQIDNPAPASPPPAMKNATPAEGKQPISETETAGEPISMVTGEELLQLTDFTLPGPMPFVWQRTYRSSHTRDSGMGCGWTHSGSDKLEATDNQITYFDDEGRAVPFHRPALHRISRYLPEGLSLECVSNNGFILKKNGEWEKIFVRPNNDITTFRLTQIRHPAYIPAVASISQPSSGFAIDFHYNGQNRISQIVGNWGKSLQLTYNEHGRLEKIDLHNAHQKLSKTVSRYTYDDHADLVAHTNAKGVGEKYQYQNHLLVQRTLITGFNFYFKWDRNDHLAKCTHNWGDHGIYSYLFDWEPENNRSKTTDSRGYTTHYIYNDHGQIIEKIDNEGHTHHYTYRHGRKQSYQDPEGHTTTYRYDDENNYIGLRDPLGTYIAFSYFKGAQTAIHDKDKSTWRREYNNQGQCTCVIDPYGQRTTYYYDRQGMLSRITDPMQRVTQHRWSAEGELLSTTDADGHTQKFRYDAWGQMIACEVIPKGEDSGSEITFEYNATGKLEKIITAKGETTSYRYNDNDQLIRYSDPQGRTTEFIYDGLSQVVERIDAEGQRLKYVYDTERNLTGLINENGDTYQFFYDGNERLIKEIGFDGREKKYAYNKAGHLIKYIDAGQVLILFERDGLGQMLTKTCRAKKQGKIVEEKTRYAYDPKGRLTEAYNAHQYLAFEYNNFGKIVKQHSSDINKNNRIKSSFADIHVDYIWPGLRSGIALPDGSYIAYAYDDKNRLTDIGYNNNLVAHIERNAFGLEVSRNQGELVTYTDYDPSGHIAAQTSINQKLKAQGPIQRNYNYDKFGNLETVKDNNEQSHYAYDFINRLTKTETEKSTEYFCFDPANNLLSQNQAPRSNLKTAEKIHGTSEGNRLLKQDKHRFTYDARGNVIKEVGDRIETHYTYNLQNQLILVEKNGITTEYTYDPLGRRIRKCTLEGTSTTKGSDSEETTRYLWLGDQLIQEQSRFDENTDLLEKSGATHTTYIYEPESFKPVALIHNNTLYHYHLDHLGTPKELTQDDGEIVWQARFKTYGSLLKQDSEKITNNLRFQGQYFDDETGLHYNRHRYYNPKVGQFTTQDPIGLLGGLNNYQYVPNPISWIDPLGLCKEGVETKQKALSSMSGIDPAESLPSSEEGGFGAFVWGMTKEFVKDTLHGAHTYITGVQPEDQGNPTGITPKTPIEQAGADTYKDNSLLINLSLAALPTSRATIGNKTKRVMDEGDISDGANSNIIGGAFKPFFSWADNPNGVVRTMDEAVEIARRNGVHIPDDIEFHSNPALDKSWFSNGEDAFAKYGVGNGRHSNNDLLDWDDMLHDVTGKKPVIVRTDVLKSDEAIVAVLGHEMHELNSLRKLMSEKPQTAQIVDGLIMDGKKGNLHYQAWDVADSLVEAMRKNKWVNGQKL